MDVFVTWLFLKLLGFLALLEAAIKGVHNIIATYLKLSHIN